MAMERVLSMEDVQDGKKQFTSVHTQTDFGPYSAFPQQPGNSAAAARGRSRNTASWARVCSHAQGSRRQLKTGLIL